MSLRFNIYGIELKALQATFGSKDRGLLQSLTKLIEAESGNESAEAEIAVLRGLIFDGVPSSRTLSEGPAYNRAIHRLATGQGLTEIDIDGWKVEGLWNLTRNFPWLVAPSNPLAWLLSGRPILGRRFETFGWAYYSYLSSEESKIVYEHLVELRSIIPERQSPTLPDASSEIRALSTRVRTDEDADRLFSHVLKYADATKLVYAAMESMYSFVGAYPKKSQEVLEEINERDDYFAGMRAYTAAMLDWFRTLQSKGLDAWIIAE